jgi:hypothetical protein
VSSDAGTRRFLIAGLIVTLVVAVGVSQLSSSDPDGLEYVAEREGLEDSIAEHTFSDFALAEYGENLSDNDVLNTAVAGLIGVVATLTLGYLLFRMMARPRAGARRGG